MLEGPTNEDTDEFSFKQTVQNTKFYWLDVSTGFASEKFRRIWFETETTSAWRSR